MADETNIEKPADSAPTASAADGTEEKRPRRRSRKPVDSEAAPGEERPSRRRTSRSVSDAGADASSAPSAEVAQARALAQVSQASVVRRQRAAEERAARMLEASEPVSADASPSSDAKPAASRRRPKQQADADGAPAAAVRKSQAETEEGSAAPKPPAPSPADLEQVAALIDPSLRPHRRGRKPKAYLEAERAAAAALAAGKLPPAPLAPAGTPELPVPAGDASAEPARKRRGRKRAEGEGAAPVSEPSASETPVDAAPSEVSDAAGVDVRPGRRSRSAKSSRSENRAEATDRKDAAERADHERDASDSKREKQPRRSHQTRDQRSGNDDQRGSRAERFDRGDRRNNRQQQGRGNKRGARFAPAEPSLSRDELSAMKVAELREKGRELDLDVTGKKKAELVEEIYLAAARAEGFRDICGILDIAHEGFGHIRAHGYMPSPDDAFVPANMIRAAGLRAGDLIEGTLRPSRAGDKYPGLAKLRSVNGVDPDQAKSRPKFSDLTPIFPNEPLKMEHGKDSITGRAIDIVSPIGKGQRGLIVSPPKAGKTTILKKICQSIAANNPEVHLICLLVDERPEEVTDMQRSIKGEVVASTFDMPADNHTRISELVIERAKRIVEMGGDVVVVLDSITRLARAYNLAAPASGRILSGGVDSAALYPPKRFLGAARNIENGGSLTILASALVDTGSKMDEVIFEEFKGTGNMELKLDRDLADRRIFPAIDPVQSGTRNEDLLIDESMRPFVWGIRRVLANMNNTERAAASFIKGLKSTNTNQEFLIRTAKKAADHPEAM